jgi:SH3-like domain-containing protein
MSRRHPAFRAPTVVLLALGLAALPVLGLAADATAPAAAGDNAAESAIGKGAPVIASVRGNSAVVRFGPSGSALSACTLHSGDTLEILGNAQVPGWYVVRMPTTGKAWVSAKVMSPLDGGKRWQIRRDGAHARADATNGAAIICDLAIGEVVEDLGSVRGDFHAVYIPNAIAYVHQSRVSLPGAAAVALQQQDASAAEAAWQAALADYGSARDQARANPADALTIKWDALADRFAAVATQHPDAAVRLNAVRCRDAILQVKAASAGVQLPGGILPPIAGPGAATTAAVAVAPGPGGATPAATAQAQAQAPATGQSGELPPLPMPVRNAATAAESHLAKGYVVVNTLYPKVGADYLLQDGNSNIVAFLTVRAPAPATGDATDAAPADAAPGVVLRDYNWMAVAVDGATQDIDPALYGGGKPVPMIVVEKVTLTGQ